jgi:hypothetical protein
MGYNSTNRRIGTVSRDHWKEIFENNPINPKHKYHFEITGIEFYETAATVQIDIWEEFDDIRKEYKDFLSLLKLESKWLIVNKIFHSESKRLEKKQKNILEKKK